MPLVSSEQTRKRNGVIFAFLSLSCFIGGSLSLVRDISIPDSEPVSSASSTQMIEPKQPETTHKAEMPEQKKSDEVVLVDIPLPQNPQPTPQTQTQGTNSTTTVQELSSSKNNPIDDSKKFGCADRGDCWKIIIDRK